MTTGPLRPWIAAGTLGVLGLLACDGQEAPPLPVDNTGGAGGGGSGGSGSGAAASGGARTGSGGVCDADPEDRCSVPVTMCSEGFCEDVCVDYFYCVAGAVYWQSCLGVQLYECPYGCEEKMNPVGDRIYTDVEAEVCNPPPATGGSLGLGGSDG